MIVRMLNDDDISFQLENDEEWNIMRLIPIRGIKNMRFIDLHEPLEKFIITLRPYPHSEEE
ncbi:MAG: hypothetical protein HY096_00480 [Nitrospinae bacterium]|nr:hypothetical protein [Nitrospinota bacterium]